MKEQCKNCFWYIYRQEPTGDYHFPLRDGYWCRKHRQWAKADEVCESYEEASDDNL